MALQGPFRCDGARRELETLADFLHCSGCKTFIVVGAKNKRFREVVHAFDFQAPKPQFPVSGPLDLPVVVAGFAVGAELCPRISKQANVGKIAGFRVVHEGARASHGLGVIPDPRSVVFFAQLDEAGLIPGIVPEFDRKADSVMGEILQEMKKIPMVLIRMEGPGELCQHDGKLGAKGLQAIQKVIHWTRLLVQVQFVGNLAGHFDAEAKIIGRLLVPALGQVAAGHVVESALDLDTGKMRGVESKPLPVR